MAEVKNKVVTVESLKTKHDYDENTYFKKTGGTINGNVTLNSSDLYTTDVYISENGENKGVIYGLAPNGTTYVANIQPCNEDGACVVGRGNWVRKEGNTNIYGNGLNLYSNNNTNINGDSINLYGNGKVFVRESNIYMDSGCNIQAEVSDGNYKNVFQGRNSNGNTVIGYDNYSGADSDTNIYGNAIHLVTNNGISTSSTLHLTKTTDADFASDNNVALIIGNRTGAHLAIDTNEILAKASGTTAADLYLCGADVYLTSNDAGTSVKPYFSKGDSFSFTGLIK